MSVVVFCGHREQITWFAGLALSLRRAGIDSNFWVLDSDDFVQAQATGAFQRVVNLLAGFTPGRHGDSYGDALAALVELEKREGHPFYHQDAAGDRLFTGLTEASVSYAASRPRWTPRDMAAMAWLIHQTAVQELAGRPLAVIGETNSLHYRLIARVAKHAGVPHLRMEQPPHLDGRMNVEEGLDARWQRCVQLYRSLESEEIPHEVERWARRKLGDIRERHVKPLYSQGVPRGAPRIWQRCSPETVRASMETWIRARRVESLYSPRGMTPQVVSPVGKLKRAVSLEWRRRYYESLIVRELPVERFATYFLHVQPEFSVEGLAFEFQDQVAQARNIVAALPADMTLLVKEHIPMAGRRSREFYGELASIPNVNIVDDKFDSLTFVKRSSLVFTLTGTVALEAMCCGVPAVIFGDIYYEAFRGIYRVRSMGELARLLHGRSELMGATEEEAIRALSARWLASYPGIYPPPPQDDANFDRLRDAMLAHLDWVESSDRS